MNHYSAPVNDLSFNPDGSAVNPGAFQQHIQRDSNLIGQLFQSDPELAQAVAGSDLNKLQDILRARHQQRSELRRREEEEIVSSFSYLSVPIVGCESVVKCTVLLLCVLLYYITI